MQGFWESEGTGVEGFKGVEAERSWSSKAPLSKNPKFPCRYLRISRAEFTPARPSKFKVLRLKFLKSRIISQLATSISFVATIYAYRTLIILTITKLSYTDRERSFA